jgi:hypothetical protein
MTEATRPGALLVCTSLLGIVGCMAPSSTPVATHDAGIAVADAVLDAIESVPEISPSDLALPETAPPDTTPPDATTPDEATPDEATPDEATPDEATPDAADEATDATEADAGPPDDAQAPDACVAPAAATETCNGLDDDCDGLTDEGNGLCDDDNRCTDDSCEAASGCVHAGNQAACDDGNPCSVGDTCVGAKCLGNAAKDCDDGNPCTIDTCGDQGACAHAAYDGQPCSAGTPCFGPGSCLAGACQPGVAKGCDDGNPCTDDSCDTVQGCVSLPSTATCEDGNACTQGDACDQGACQAGPNTCECQSDADCAAKPGGNPCQGKLICDMGGLAPACVVQAGTAVVCGPGGGACAVQACDPTTGTCKPAAVNEGLGCEDGSACTQGDACSGGACKPGALTTCDDGNPCTQDGCDVKLGCVHAASAGACEDGNACTLGDTCKGAACLPGGVKPCEDGNACTVDSCDPSSGSCVHDQGSATGKACGSGLGACISGASCQAGACVAGPAVDCSDGNPCTADGCDAAVGCVHSPIAGPCSDGNPCTDEACLAGKCATQAKNCDDGNPCTTDACDAGTGLCTSLGVPGCVTHAQRAIGGAYTDQFWSVRATGDGGWLAAGESASWGAGSGDGLVVRSDAAGKPVWIWTYGGPGKDLFLDARPTADGGFLLAGVSYGADPSGNFLVVRIDGTGAPLWTWTGGGPSYDFAKAIAATSDGGCIVVGKTYSFGPNTPGEHNGLAVKLDAKGKLQWSKVFAAPEGTGSMDTSGVGEVKDSAGQWNGFLIIGGSEGFGMGSDDVWLTRLTADGTHLWSVAHGGSGDDDPQTGFVQTADGGFVVGFWETGFGAQKTDAGLLKTDANGNLLWMKRYGGYAKEEPYGLVQVGGDFVLTGYSNSWSEGGIDAFLMRVGPTGDLVWWRTYGGPLDEASQGVAVTLDGGFVLAGRGNSAGKGGFDGWQAKTGADGLIGCQDVTVTNVQVASITPTTTWFTPVILTAGATGSDALTVGSVDASQVSTVMCPCK